MVSLSKKIEILLSSDTAVGISKSNALALISFAEAFEELKPEIVVLLGDRTETFAAAQAALINGVPVAHIHGGELTEGAYDDAIRHSITKMSHLHFTATETFEPQEEKSDIATMEMREFMFELWRNALLKIGFMHEDKANHMMYGLRRILSRGQLTQDDVKILMGIARQAEWASGEYQNKYETNKP